MIDRRKFLQKSAAAGASVFIGTKVSFGATTDVNLEEATVFGLQAAMSSGQSTSRTIAEGYLVLQQGANQDQARSAGQWLSGEIDGLRKKVADAESRVEDFRSKESLFIGTNNTTLSNQQMGEINTQLNNARAQKSDAESKSHLIREMLQSGGAVEVSDVLNTEFSAQVNPLIRRSDIRIVE